MKKWEDMSLNEKREEVISMNEDFAFLQSYDDSKTAAHGVRKAYEKLVGFFNFEVGNLDSFEKDVRYFIDEEFYRCPMEGRNPSLDGLAS